MATVLEQLRDISVANTYRLHDLLDRVLGMELMTFPEMEIKFDPDHVVFASTIDDYQILVQRNMNMFTVDVNVIDNNNERVAACTINIEGKFNESYSRMKPDVKTKISEWFTNIGNNIDVEALIDQMTEDETKTEAESAENEDNIVEETVENNE